MSTRALSFYLAEVEHPDRTTDYISSLDQPITIDGQVYEGMGDLIQITSLSEQREGVPNSRLTVSFAAVEEETRKELLVDEGPQKVTIKWAYIDLEDGADKTVKLLNRTFIGRISNPKMNGITWSCELETPIGDADKGKLQVWSDQSQQEEFPGDKGLEFLKDLTKGVEIFWPPED